MGSHVGPDSRIVVPRTVRSNASGAAGSLEPHRFTVSICRRQIRLLLTCGRPQVAEQLTGARVLYEVAVTAGLGGESAGHTALADAIEADQDHALHA